MGGIITVSTKISGGVANPGIPFIDSPTGGLFETPLSGVGMSLAGVEYLTLENNRYTLGPKPAPVFDLVNVVGSPWATPSGYGYAVVISPDGRHVYVNDNFNSIFFYTRDTATGALVYVNSYAGLPSPGRSSIQITPDGRFIIFTGSSASHSAAVFMRNAITGVLTAVAGSPFLTNYYCTSLHITADGSTVYIAAPLDGKLLGYSINQITGYLTPLVGSPYSLVTNNATSGISSTPDGKFVYVTDSTGNNISAFSRDIISGVLTAVNGSPFASIAGSYSPVVTPDGLFLIAGSANVPAFETFSINSTTGALSTVGTFASVTSTSMDMSPDGKYLFVCNNSPYIQAYAISSGIPTYTTQIYTGLQSGALRVSSDGGSIVVTDGYGDYKITAINTSMNATFNLIESYFDVSGGLQGIVNINGELLIAGQVTLSQNLADSRYAAIAGLVTQPFSAKSLTLDHAAGGIVGTPAADNAPAGYVGEYKETSVAAGAAVALTTAIPANVAILALTAGDWDVQGVVAYHSSGTTNVHDCSEGINTVTATLPVTPGDVHCDYLAIVVPAAPDPAYGASRVRISLAAPANVYLVALSNFTISTLSAYGKIHARRVR